MLENFKARPKWQQGLLLFAVGGVVGYFSLNGLTRDMWGGSSPSDFQGLFGIIFFASATAFIAGIVLLFTVAVKALTTSAGSARSAIVGSPAAAAAVSSHGAQRPFPDASVERQAIPSALSAVLLWLRIAIVAAITMAVIDLLHQGGPPLSSRYGRYYFLSALLTFVLGRFPLAVALIRIRRVPDAAGLGLAMVAGAVQVLGVLPFFAYLQYPANLRDPWSWLHVLLGAAVFLSAYLGWRWSGSRQEDAGLLVSIFFGFLAYTLLARIALAIITHGEGVP
jgi:hypothetical protein